MLDKLASETAGPFLAGEHVTIADCLAMATLQFAEGHYGVPLPSGCPALADWFAMFAKRPSAAPMDHPATLAGLAYCLPDLCPPSAQ